MDKFLERHKLLKLTQKGNISMVIKQIEFALEYILSKNFRPKWLHCRTFEKERIPILYKHLQII